MIDKADMNSEQDTTRLTRVLIKEDPFAPGPRDFQAVNWRRPDYWPGRWVASPDSLAPPFVMAYRCRLNPDAELATRIHVSADERYALYLNGEAVGRGPERGDGAHWHFESYDLVLPPGEHRLVAVVWSLGGLAPTSQISVRHGFILAAENHSSDLSTGVARWECKSVDGITFHNGDSIGAFEEIDGSTYPWGIETGAGDDWVSVSEGEKALPAHHAESYPRRHLLIPAELPAQYQAKVEGLKIRRATGEAENSWQKLLDSGAPLNVPARTCQEILIDCDEYVCAYPQLMVSGGEGARIDLEWAEALFDEESGKKGNRDDVDGKCWRGKGDTFLPDGGEKRRFAPLWWRSGRYLLLKVQTAEEPLVFEQLVLTETRYPLEQSCLFDAELPQLQRVWPIMLRGLQMCAHETYMDCPYYEQLQYVGDTRLEALTTFVLTPDAQLPRKAIRDFYFSLLPTGFTQSRYPSRSMQVIPPFSLWWVCMVHDYAWWRDDAETVQSVLPGVRSVINSGESLMGDDGVIRHLPGWNFVDWVTDESWRIGVPDDGGSGSTSPVQWQWILTLQAACELEEHFGSSHLAAHNRDMLTRALAGAELFWDESRSLYANDLGHSHWSEHANCLALCSESLSPERKEAVGTTLFSEQDLPRASIYYSHYYLEAARLTGRLDAYNHRLEEWYDLADQGFRTTREMPEPSRSDCHGWGAHPIFHTFASLVGIRPTAPGFASLIIEPMPGLPQPFRCEIPHPRGTLKVEVANGEVSFEAPPGVTVSVPAACDQGHF
jgi:alpha-L-rhamnosidase